MRTIDWRANQLADLLAKKGAITTDNRTAITARIANAKTALVHHAAILGTTTFAANNVKRIVTQADGSTRTKILRESSALEWRRGPATCKKRKMIAAKQSVAIPAASGAFKMNVSAKALRTARLIRSSKAVELGKKKTLCELVTDMAHAVRPREAAANDGCSDTERLQLLRARVLAKAPRITAVKGAVTVAFDEPQPKRYRLRGKTRTLESV